MSFSCADNTGPTAGIAMSVGYGFMAQSLDPWLFICLYMQVLEGIAVPVDLSDREALVKAANT